MLMAPIPAASRGLAQVVYTDKANRDGGKREGVTDDAPRREGRAAVVSVAVFHFAKRRRAQ
jgi:hypothetical protein